MYVEIILCSYLKLERHCQAWRNVPDIFVSFMYTQTHTHTHNCAKEQRQQLFNTAVP